MKRILCLILAAALLSGCHFQQQDNSTTAFYYCRMSTSNTQTDCLIVSESRDISLESTDLKSLLTLYLIGPQDEELVSPFRGMKLDSLDSDNTELRIGLSYNDRSLTDARFTLASACLTKTCLELTGANQVTITCGNRSVTMNHDNLLLEDTITTTEMATEETQ